MPQRRSNSRAERRAEHVVLVVKVVAGASRDAVVGRYGEGVKVAVSAVAERGRANEAVVRVLAEWLGVGARQIELVGGHVNPRKRFRISGLEEGVLRARLSSFS